MGHSILCQFFWGFRLRSLNGTFKGSIQGRTLGHICMDQIGSILGPSSDRLSGSYASRGAYLMMQGRVQHWANEHFNSIHAHQQSFPIPRAILPNLCFNQYSTDVLIFIPGQLHKFHGKALLMCWTFNLGLPQAQWWPCPALGRPIC